MENDRDCPHCKHKVRVKDKEGKYEDYYMCEKWDCEYEPEDKTDEERESNRSSDNN